MEINDTQSMSIFILLMFFFSALQQKIVIDERFHHKIEENRLRMRRKKL